MSRSTPVRNALRTMGQLPLEISTLRRLAEEASENTPSNARITHCMIWKGSNQIRACEGAPRWRRGAPRSVH